VPPDPKPLFTVAPVERSHRSAGGGRDAEAVARVMQLRAQGVPVRQLPEHTGWSLWRCKDLLYDADAGQQAERNRRWYRRRQDEARQVVLDVAGGGSGAT
jgi:hypothetical protein